MCLRSSSVKTVNSLVSSNFQNDKRRTIRVILAGFLQLLNASADASGFLVVFLCRQCLKFLPQLRALGLGSLGARCSTRGFSGVSGFSMNAFQEWKQLRFE